VYADYLPRRPRIDSRLIHTNYIRQYVVDVFHKQSGAKMAYLDRYFYIHIKKRVRVQDQKSNDKWKLPASVSSSAALSDIYLNKNVTELILFLTFKIQNIFLCTESTGLNKYFCTMFYITYMSFIEIKRVVHFYSSVYLAD
jgi:hypothetical protein